MVWSMESLFLVRSTKHVYKGVPFFLTSSCRSHATNIVSTVGHRCLVLHCSSGRTISQPQCVVAKAPRDVCEEYFASVHHKNDGVDSFQAPFYK